MKKFAIRFGQYNTVDILKMIGAAFSGGVMLALVASVESDHAYSQGQHDMIDYMNSTEQYDTSSAAEIRRRGQIYAAKQFLAENDAK